MEADERVRRRFETLADRVKEELVRHLTLESDELAKLIEAERAAAAADAARNERTDADREANERVAKVEASRAAGIAGEVLATERLVASMQAIDRSRSLTETLDALVSAAGHEAGRAMLILAEGDQLRPWRSVGFAAGDAWTEVPIKEAGAALKTRRTDARSATEQKTSTEEGGRAPSSAGVARGRGSLAVPIDIGGEIVAVLYADRGTDEAHGAGSESPWAARVEALVGHAARSLELMVALRSAKVLANGPVNVPSGLIPSSTPATAAEDEETARRYARLLISEIKLYHEQAVVAGRRERDLATRLSSEIARARALYEERVPPHVPRAAETFEVELVRTLADGDPSLLGGPKARP